MLASLVAYVSQGLNAKSGWIHHNSHVIADPVGVPPVAHQGRAVTGALSGIRNHCVVHLPLLVPAEEVYARMASHVFTSVEGREQAGRGSEPVVCRRSGLCRRRCAAESAPWPAMPDTWWGGAGRHPQVSPSCARNSTPAGACMSALATTAAAAKRLVGWPLQRLLFPPPPPPDPVALGFSIV